MIKRAWADQIFSEFNWDAVPGTLKKPFGASWGCWEVDTGWPDMIIRQQRGIGIGFGKFRIDRNGNTLSVVLQQSAGFDCLWENVYCETWKIKKGGVLERVGKSPWIVHTKGAPGKSFEIAVVRRDNHHGISSYGWFGEDKMLISHNGGPCKDSVSGLVWDELVAVATKVAKELNKREK